LARLIVVSNRVAVPNRDGSNQAGGLAVAVRSLLKRHEGLWFGWSGTVSSDEDVATKPVKQGGLSYVITDLAEADYQEYYNGFANRVLWPILHYRLDLAEFSRRDLSGYRRVNAHFANQLTALLRPDDIVWVLTIT
jgi:trehalose 6-phosphate synthase